MLCKNCGSQLDDNSKFCAVCGTKVLDGEPVNEEKVVIDDSVSSVQDSLVNDVSNLESNSVFPNSGSVPNLEANGVFPNSGSVPNLEANGVFPNSSNVPDLEPGSIMPVSDGSQGSLMGNGVNSSLSDGSKKGKKNFVPPIIGIIAILLIVGGIYFYFNNNKKGKAIERIINNAFDKLEGLVSTNDSNVEKQSFLINGSMSMSTNIPGLEDLNSEKINFTFGTDYSNNKAKLGVSLEEDNSKVIEAFMYLLNNKSYISLGDIFDKLIMIDSDYGDIFKSSSAINLSNEDVRYIIKAYNSILIDSLDSEDFETSKATITLDGKDTKVTKLSYNMTSERLNKFVNNIIDGTLKDSKLLSILAKASGSSVDYIESGLEMAKNSSSVGSQGESVVFDIYTKGHNNEFVGMDIQGIIQIRKNNDNLTIEAGIATEKVSIVIKPSDDSLLIDMNSNIGGQNIKCSLSISSREVSSNNYEGTFEVNFSVDNTYFNVKSTFNQKNDVTLDDIDVSDAVASEDLTTEELERISTNLENRLMGSKLYKIFEDFSYLSNSTFNY